MKEIGRIDLEQDGCPTWKHGFKKNKFRIVVLRLMSKKDWKKLKYWNHFRATIYTLKGCKKKMKNLTQSRTSP